MQLTSARFVCPLVLGLALGSSAFAQEAEQPTAPVVEASTNCFATFAIGTVTYCVSEHGNVARFTSPAAAPEHIRVGVVREGYAVCAANASRSCSRCSLRFRQCRSRLAGSGHDLTAKRPEHSSALHHSKNDRQPGAAAMFLPHNQ